MPLASLSGIVDIFYTSIGRPTWWDKYMLLYIAAEVQVNTVIMVEYYTVKACEYTKYRQLK